MNGTQTVRKVAAERRERAVAIRPLGHGLMMHTLCGKKEVHDPGELFAGVPGVKPDAAMVKRGRHLIGR